MFPGPTTMAENLTWTTALKWTVWAVLMALVMAWLGRSRFRMRPASDTPMLAHPPSTLIVGLGCFGFFAGIAVLSNVVPNKTTTWWTTSIFVGFALTSTPMVVDYFRAR